MKVAINDLAFLKGFRSKEEARTALLKFGVLVLKLRDGRVSNVDVPLDIVNSSSVNKYLMITEKHSLMQVLNDIAHENRELFISILQILAMVGENVEGSTEEFSACGLRSVHCARNKDNFLLSIVSDQAFAGEIIKGELNGRECKIRNIADERHIGIYWEDLGFRLYELNPKHGRCEYVRAGGELVGIAPETDEIGQKLLNQVMVYKGKLFSVDKEKNNRIFEFRHTCGNKFHAFLQNNLPEADRKKIIELSVNRG